MRLASFDDIAYIVTDAEIDGNLKDILVENNVEIINI